MDQNQLRLLLEDPRNPYKASTVPLKDMGTRRASSRPLKDFYVRWQERLVAWDKNYRIWRALFFINFISFMVCVCFFYLMRLPPQ